MQELFKIQTLVFILSIFFSLLLIFSLSSLSLATVKVASLTLALNKYDAKQNVWNSQDWWLFIEMLFEVFFFQYCNYLTLMIATESPATTKAILSWRARFQSLKAVHQLRQKTANMVFIYNSSFIWLYVMTSRLSLWHFKTFEGEHSEERIWTDVQYVPVCHPVPTHGTLKMPAVVGRTQHLNHLENSAHCKN